MTPAQGIGRIRQRLPGVQYSVGTSCFPWKLTVVGLPGCGGGGGSPNVRDDETWQPTTSFVGPDDEVVFYHEQPRTARSARRPQGGSPLQANAQQGMLGTPVVQTDETGAVYNRQASTPYGVRTGQDGSGADEFKFTDKEWDDDLRLVYFGARYYDPELSTWISVDPLVLWGDDGSLSAFDQNPLAYVGGRVTLAVDEFGFEGFEVRERGLSMEQGRDIQDSQSQQGDQLGLDVDLFVDNQGIRGYLESAEEAGLNLDEVTLFRTVAQEDGSAALETWMTGAEFMERQGVFDRAANANRIEGGIKVGIVAVGAVIATASTGGMGPVAVALALSVGGAGLYQLASGEEAKTGFSEIVGGAAGLAGADDQTVDAIENVAVAAEVIGGNAYSIYTLSDDVLNQLGPFLYRKLFQVPVGLAADEAGNRIADDD